MKITAFVHTSSLLMHNPAGCGLAVSLVWRYADVQIKPELRIPIANLVSTSGVAKSQYFIGLEKIIGEQDIIAINEGQSERVVILDSSSFPDGCVTRCGASLSGEIR